MNIGIYSQYNFLPRFFKLAIVNALSAIMIPLASAISVAFLGHLSNISYLAGVALASVLFNYLYEGCAFIRSGTTAITAQAVGRDDREAMLLAGLQNGSIALGLGILILLLQYPVGKLGFALLNATPETTAVGMAYFNETRESPPKGVLVGWGGIAGNNEPCLQPNLSYGQEGRG
ncbi:MAG: MATE family efflux transporter [Heteroscytonema crispum UTEX LB 1556]